MTSPSFQGAIRTPDQRLRVFVSSTMKELAEERAALKDAISALRMSPVLFETGARPHPPRDLYRAYVEQSDVFVGVYAREYGWVAPDMAISGIEDELLLSTDKPRLIYVKDSLERDPRLQAMIARITGEADLSYKRFGSAEQLRELVADDLALLITERFQARAGNDAAPVSEGRPCELPSYPTTLVGRDRDLEELTSLLLRDDVRVVTLVGPGGTGKSRLAVEVAWRVCASFPDGAVFVPLADLHDADLVAPTIAAQLGIGEGGGAEEGALIEELKRRKMLLVLDNFEQVVDAAPAVAEIVEQTREVTLLVTSREPLQIYGEREFPVAPLSLTAGEAENDAAPGSPAVRLFVDRAQAVRPDFALTPENARDVAEICQRLDGLPLALELAAARVRVLPPRSILERLADHLSAPGARGRPERQRTMRAAIAWSYDLLSEPERRVFERLGVFAGGFDVAAAETVCADASGEEDPLEVVASLTTKSVVRAFDDPEPRFMLLELMRAYALEKLEQRGELEQARDAHAAYFARYADINEDLLVRSPGERGRRELDREYANLRDALEWSIARTGHASEASRWVELLLVTLYFYWYVSGRSAYVSGHSEGREWSERALAAATERGDNRARAASLFALGSQAMWQGALHEGRHRLEESVALWREVGDIRRLGLALMVEAIAALNQGHSDAAKEGLTEAEDLLERAGNVPARGITLMHLGDVTSRAGDPDGARAYLLEALGIQRGLGAEWATAATLNSLGELERVRGDHAAAGEHYREALARFEALQDPGDIARCHHALGYVALRGGNDTVARELLDEALDWFERADNKRGMAEAMMGFAALHAAKGEHARAARLIGAGDRALEEIDAGLWPADERERERDLSAIRAGLGDDATDLELRAGRELALADAVAIARTETP